VSHHLENNESYEHKLTNGTILTSFGTRVASRQIISSYLTVSELHNVSPDTDVPIVTQK